MRSLFLVLTLLAAPAAWGQSVQQTSQAAQTVRSDLQKLGTLQTQRRQLAQRYADQLAKVDGLKKQKASWRRDRELRQALADSADTSSQLAQLDTQLGTVKHAIGTDRQALLAAIDREKPTAQGSRIAELDKLRAQVVAEVGAPAKKIVLPDAEVDPLADPEELDQQAQVIAETEKQLATQVASLDSQASELAHVSDLRKHNERAKDLMLSEDDQPHRNVQRSTGGGRETVGDSAPTTNGGAGDTAGGGASGTGTFSNPTPAFETEATFVLGEVIDRTTIDGLTRAQRSGDPGKRAEAARNARDAVAARLDTLKKKRAQIESRAKLLRQKR
ncbi:MAG TPA: hypothetical protein VGC41_20470 [Kofleriaceae bacterium]